MALPTSPAPSSIYFACLPNRTKQLLISLPTERPREGEAPAEPSPVKAARQEPRPPTIGEAPRIDLFTKTTATLAALKRAFPQLVVRTHSAPHASCPAIDHVTEQVFHYPHSPPAPAVLESLGQIEIVQAAGTHDEVLQISPADQSAAGRAESAPGRSSWRRLPLAHRSTRPRIAEVFHAVCDSVLHRVTVHGSARLQFTSRSSHS